MSEQQTNSVIYATIKHTKFFPYNFNADFYSSPETGSCSKTCLKIKSELVFLVVQFQTSVRSDKTDLQLTL